MTYRPFVDLVRAANTTCCAELVKASQQAHSRMAPLRTEWPWRCHGFFGRVRKLSEFDSVFFEIARNQGYDYLLGGKCETNFSVC
jgi:hypothetical protein